MELFLGIILLVNYQRVVYNWPSRSWSLKNGDVLVFDRMTKILFVAIWWSRCPTTYPSSAKLSAKNTISLSKKAIENYAGLQYGLVAA